MVGLSLNLPKLNTGNFKFTSQSQALPHGRERVRLTLLDWMLKYRRELKPNLPFDLVSHPFLEQIYRETAKRLVICKSGQAGVSEYLVSYALHACDQRDATVLYVFPTDNHVSDFSAARLGSAIECSDYLSSIVVEGRAAGADTKIRKRGADRVTLKRIRDRYLYFRGGKVDAEGRAAQLKSIDADCVIIDEWDEIDPRAPVIAHERLGHSKIGEERAVSTPTYAGRGIHAEYQMSDQRQWHIRCAHCGHWQPLSIQHIVHEWDELERPVAWFGQSTGRAFCACSKCYKELDRLGDGQWIATNPSADVVGYHISKLFSSLYDPLDAVMRLRSTNETVRKECNNQVLGLPHRPRGGGLDDAALDACIRQYAHGLAQGGCYMGIDVGDVLNVIVRSQPHSESGERRQLYAGEITWAELAGIYKRYNPAMTVLDAMPETTKAREFQALAPSRIWLAYYPGEMKDDDPIRKNDDERYILMDRTRTLDLTIARFMDQENTLPANAKEIQNYYAQMKAPVRVIEETPRGNVAKYVESTPDHYCHAENYCTAASMLVATGAFHQGVVRGRGGNPMIRTSTRRAS